MIQNIPGHEDAPRTLADEAERARRLAMLDEPHIAPPTNFIRRLRATRPELMIPNVDPLDGGTGARMIFVFEAPGSNTLETNFISRNNDDRTAEATFRFMQMAGIPRSETMIWNTGPGWDRDITNSARTAGRDAAPLRGFVEVLPRLGEAGVVLVGGAARRYAQPLVAERGLLTFETVHPSPRAQGLLPTGMIGGRRLPIWHLSLGRTSRTHQLRCTRVQILWPITLHPGAKGKRGPISANSRLSGLNGAFSIATLVKAFLVTSCHIPSARRSALANVAARGSCFSSRLARDHLMMG